MIVMLPPKAFGTTTLGALIAALEAAPQDADCHYDFCCLRPNGLASCRGYYDHLALGWSAEPISPGRYRPTVATVLKELKGVVGVTLTGWKGGEFEMGINTPIWVANRSETGSTAISGLQVDEDTVVIMTQHVG